MPEDELPRCTWATTSPTATPARSIRTRKLPPWAGKRYPQREETPAFTPGRMSFDRLEVGGVELLVEASIPHRSV